MLKGGGKGGFSSFVVPDTGMEVSCSYVMQDDYRKEGRLWQEH